MVANSILVTGANRGLGLELVRQLAAGTATQTRPNLIIAACRNPADASDLIHLAEQSGDKPKISLIRLDVTDEKSIDQSYDETAALCAAYGGLNLIINNAGVFPAKCTPELFGFESMTECLKGNVVGPTILCKRYHPLLVKSAAAAGVKSVAEMSVAKSGIVMMSSNLGSIENTRNAMSYPYYAYNSSKAALNMVMKCLSLEFEKDGILVSSIHPGWVQTDMGGEQAPLTKEESIAHMIKTIAKMETGKFYNYDFAESGKYLPW